MIFDTHTHAYFEELASREAEVLSNMKNNGVTKAVQIGCDSKSSASAVALANRHPGTYYATVGLHPTEAQILSIDAIADEIGALRRMILENRKSVVAVGETGWDFFHLPEDPETREKYLKSQGLAFKLQSELARDFNLPLVIHTRNSGEATLRSLAELNIEKAVIHCFSEDLEFAKSAMDHSAGIRFGFSGILTYKSAKNVQEVAKNIPLDRILIETDAPFLSPDPERGTTNESAKTRYVLEKLKSLRSESPAEIENAVYDNSLKFYGIEA